MALSLSCSCGARFEVEDTFAGQDITCPECGAPLKVPAPQRTPARTSSYAVASVVLALVGAFTVVGTAAAVVVGLIALASIRRNRNRLTGAGYAVFGIVAGLIFTGLTLLAYSAVEVFGVGDKVREKMMGGQVDRGGPLEIIREKDGYAITRPSTRWGIARQDLMKELDNDSDLLLVNPGKDAYLDVSVIHLGNQSLDEYGDQIVAMYRDPDKAGGKNDALHRLSGFRLRGRRHLPAVEGAEVLEIVLDVRVGGQAMTFLDRVFKERDGGRGYVLRAWAFQRRFPHVEAEVRQMQDSFRLLAED